MDSSTLAEQLRLFLSEPINTVSREALLAHRFMYDMTLAAASSGYALLSFSPAVDRDGVDIVLSDHDIVKPVQLKSTTRHITPSSLIKNVHASVLKPHHDLADRIQFAKTGQGGAVVLMEIWVESQESLGVRYWYTDAQVLSALSHRFVPGAPKNAERDAKTLINTLHDVRSNDRVNVPLSCFVPLRNTAALLGIGGWHAPHPFHNGNWQFHLGERVRLLTREEIDLRQASNADNPNFSAEAQDKRWERLIADALSEFIAWPMRGKSKKTMSTKPAV